MRIKCNFHRDKSVVNGKWGQETGLPEQILEVLVLHRLRHEVVHTHCQCLLPIPVTRVRRDAANVGQLLRVLLASHRYFFVGITLIVLFYALSTGIKLSDQFPDFDDRRWAIHIR